MLPHNYKIKKKNAPSTKYSSQTRETPWLPKLSQDRSSLTLCIFKGGEHLAMNMNAQRRSSDWVTIYKDRHKRLKWQAPGRHVCTTSTTVH